jgi:glycosyltransferase involved in cell wall biosynthesis
LFLEPNGTGLGPEGHPPEYACSSGDFGFVRSLVEKLIVEEGCVILHCHGRRPGLWGRILRARHPRHVRTILSFHGIASFDRPKRMFVALQECVFSLVTDQFIAAAPAEVQMFRFMPMAAPICVIPNSYNAEAIVSWSPRPIRRIGFCGRFERPKLHDDLIRVVATYNQAAQEPLTLIFVGDGRLRAATDALGDRMLGANYISLGHVPSISEFYSRIDAFAHFSRYEGLPVALLDAMACGMPCIATNVIGCRDAIEDGVSGLLVPLDDIQASVAQLRKLVEDPKTASRLAANADARAHTVFAPEAFWIRHCEIYERLARELGSTWS